MKKVIFCTFFLTAVQMLFAQDNPEYKKLIVKADSLYKVKDYKASGQNYSLAFKTLGWKGAQADRYNAARSWALANSPDSAFYCLDRIVKMLGYSDLEKISTEEDFNSLHADKRWPLLLNDVKQNKLPTGWYRTGGDITAYKMSLDSVGGQNKKKALTIKSTVPKIDNFGALAQTFAAEKYLGKRIRMSGYMRSSDVKGWAGFWLRIDPENSQSQRSLAFDNMQDRPVKETTDWKKYEIVLDVPKSASSITFGALLNSTGQIWFEQFNFEIVDSSVPLTGRKKDEPNLDFDK